LQLTSVHEVPMNLPTELLILNRGLFHKLPVLEKACRSTRGQRLVGVDRSRLGGSNAGH